VSKPSRPNSKPPAGPLSSAQKSVNHSTAPRTRAQPPSPSAGRHQPAPNCLQAKSAQGRPQPTGRAPHTPAAPPVYRPQPVPKVLQPKAATPQPAAQTRPAPAAPPAYRPQPTPRVLQPKQAVGQPPAAGSAPRRPVAPPVYRPAPPKIVQPKTGVVAGRGPLAGRGERQLTTLKPPHTSPQRQASPALRPGGARAVQLKGAVRNGRPPVPPAGSSRNAIQRTLLKGRAQSIEDQLSDLMNSDNALTRDIAGQIYPLIGKDTHDHEAARMLAEMATASGVPDFQDIADTITVGGARLNYYPSGFDATARKNRDDYVTKHPGGSPNTWKCPGVHPYRPAHDAAVADVTIDHIRPVADHWNKVGFDTDKATRAQWFNDIKNHEILCRSCNSSKGSGGISYTKSEGPHFSH